MKSLIIILVIGVCVASPDIEVKPPAKINEEKIYKNPEVPEDVHFETVPVNVPQTENSDLPKTVLEPVGPIVEDKSIQVGQPIDLVSDEEKPEGKPEGDLKTDATFWYGGGYRSWGYPSWGYPSYGRSFYTTRYYYRPSFYRWYSYY